MSVRLPILDGDDKIPTRFLPAGSDLTGGGDYARGIVTFSWDDGYQPSWNTLMAKAADLGQTHTLAIRTDRTDTDAASLTSADILRFFSEGHEIASHTVSHPSLGAGTTADIVAELNNSKTALEAIVGAGNVTSFVYPYGDTSDDIHRKCWGRYDRVLDYKMACVTAIDDRLSTYVIPRTQVQTFAQGKQLIDLAIHQPVIVNLAGHNPGGNFSGGAADPLALQDALDLMQYCYDNGVPVVRADKVYPGGSLLANPSFETGTTIGWRTTGAGANAVVTVTPDTHLAGTKALQVAPTTVGGGGARQILPVTPGRSYTLSGRARLTVGTIAAGSVKARIVGHDYEGPESTDGLAVGTELAATANITSSSWTRFEISAVIPQGIRYADVQLRVADQTGLTSQWDHLHFGPTEFGAHG